MKKLFKTFFVLSIILLVSGAGIALAGVSMGGTLDLLWKNTGTQSVPDGDNIQDTENIKELHIEMATGEMIIEQGSYESVMVAADDSKMKVDTNVDGDDLYIECHGKLGGQGGVTKIYLPSDLKLEQIEIDLGAGAVTADSLIADEISIEVGAGSFESQDLLKAKQLHCDVGMGEILIAKANCDHTELSCSMGTIEIIMEGTMQDYYLDGECALGEINCAGMEWNSSDEIHAGTQTSDKIIEAECSMGSITIDFE